VLSLNLGCHLLDATTSARRWSEPPARRSSGPDLSAGNATVNPAPETVSTWQNGAVLLDSLSVDPGSFSATGWSVEPQGACRGDVCVPLPVEARVAGGAIDVTVVAERLGMPLVHDAEHELWALGPATVGGRALATATAAELTLPDLDGRPFTLSSLRGRKVLLLAWASW
jgi:hypothetical protein